VTPRYEKESGSEKIEGGFFARLFGFGREGSKKRTFRQLKKQLASCKLDVYRLKQDTISVPFARSLFEIYRLTGPLRQLVPLDKGDNKLPYAYVEAFIHYYQSDTAREIAEKLTDEYINNYAANHGVKNTITYIDNLLNEYFNLFDQAVINRINLYYTNFHYFIRLAHFDFFPILREFDEALEEENFLVKPNFQAADGALLREELLKLHYALFRFTVNESIDQGIEIVSQLKNVEPISRNAVHRLKRLIKEFQDNQYVSLIVQAIDLNPSTIPIRKPTTIEIYSSYAARRKGDVRNTLHTVRKRHRDQAVSSIVAQLFGDGASSRLKNYTDAKNDQLGELGLPVYEHATPLNYTKAFSMDCYNAFIRNVVNELIIAGSFNNKTILNNLSNNYYALNNLIKKIDEFDDDLDIDGSSGTTIQRFMDSVNKDKSARGILEKTIIKLNNKARGLMTEEIVNVKEMAFIIKKILDEYKLNTPTIVYNIKKIRNNKNNEFIQDLVSCYKYIYLYLRLMGSYVSLKVTKDEILKQQSDITDIL
jgi:hypothetical protein